MQADNVKKHLLSLRSVMKMFSDSMSLLSVASHDMDLRKRTLFKGDQIPVENGLLFARNLASQ